MSRANIVSIINIQNKLEREEKKKKKKMGYSFYDYCIAKSKSVILKSKY